MGSLKKWDPEWLVGLLKMRETIACLYAYENDPVKGEN